MGTTGQLGLLALAGHSLQPAPDIPVDESPDIQQTLNRYKNRNHGQAWGNTTGNAWHTIWSCDGWSDFN